MTGVETYENVLAAIPIERPTFLVEHLDQLFESYPEIAVEAENDAYLARAEGWTARAEGQSLTVSGEGSQINAWRVACAAWWALHPEHDQPLHPEVFNRDF